jgi:hypothetical protein
LLPIAPISRLRVSVRERIGIEMRERTIAIGSDTDIAETAGGI